MEPDSSDDRDRSPTGAGLARPSRGASRRGPARRRRRPVRRLLLARRARGAGPHLESPWDESLPSVAAEAAVIADWGVRPVAGTEAALYVDHHAEPEPVAGAVLQTAAGGPTTSTLAWELLDRPEDGEWLAALGVVGDLGADALKGRPGLARG